MIRETGVQEPAGRVSRICAGGILQNKKQLGNLGIFENRLQPKCSSLQREFRDTGNRQGITLSHQPSEQNAFAGTYGVHFAVTRYAAFGSNHFNP